MIYFINIKIISAAKWWRYDVVLALFNYLGVFLMIE